MRKLKRLSVLSAAAVLSLGALSLTACGTDFVLPNGIPEGAVSSNGGFVVEKGEYVYFINGVQDHTADNVYGEVEKGSLMRAKKADVVAGKNTAETVVPLLMVSADYKAGIFIYGDRVYYATPNNDKNADGEVQSDYLSFRSAKLDGSDEVKYFSVENNASEFRFVEAGAEGAKSVYLLYKDEADLHSYNTATKVDTLLAQGTQTCVFDGASANNPTVYYTMSVTADMDKDTASPLDYKQVYRVTADTTVSPYTYTFDEEYVKEYKEENDGKEPYVNLGTIVLDGVGSKREVTQFTHADTASLAENAGNEYDYELVKQANGGVYFTRKNLYKGETAGQVYYLSAEKMEKSDWNSITGNDALDMIAQDNTNASATALYFIVEGMHGYVYVSGNNVKRAVVENTLTGEATEQIIARNTSAPTLSFLDDTSSETYLYVYYTMTNGSGVSVNRAVYSGSPNDYNELNAKKEFAPVQVLDVQHASSWYPFEVADGVLYFADAESFESTSYNYVAAVSLRGAEGKLLNNAEVAAFNEKYDEVVDYIEEVGKTNSKLSTAIKSYFYTGKRNYFDDNIQFAIDNGEKETALYSEEDKAAFTAYVNGKEGETDLAFKDYRLLSNFVTRLGVVTEEDNEAMDTYWTNTLEHFTEEEETEEGLPAWAWALIGVGIGLVVVAGVVTTVVLVRKKKHKKVEAAPKKQRMVVDTTDDKSVDVYAADEPVAPVQELEEEQTEVSAEEEATAAEEPAPQPTEE